MSDFIQSNISMIIFSVLMILAFYLLIRMKLEKKIKKNMSDINDSINIDVDKFQSHSRKYIAKIEDGAETFSMIANSAAKKASEETSNKLSEFKKVKK